MTFAFTSRNGHAGGQCIGGAAGYRPRMHDLARIGPFLNDNPVVDLRGIEPPTSCLQGRRSPV